MPTDSRFVQCPSLQDFFIDKDNGLPLTAGIVTFYKDTARTIKKNVYKQTGSPPDYTYEALPNPITLSGVGTFADADGNDILIYLFPYEGSPDDDSNTVENYYITVESSGHILQFTRANIPGLIQGNTQVLDDIINYIPNGQFITHTDIPESSDPPFDAGEVRQGITIIAQGGWTFERDDDSTAADFVTFDQFSGGGIYNPSGNPPYAVKVSTTDSGSGGELIKDLRVKFNNVNKFQTDPDNVQEYTFSFSSKSDNSNANLDITVWLIKNYGDGGSAQEEFQLGDTISLDTSYTTYSIPFDFGNNSGKTIGDGSFIQLAIRFPTQSIFSAAATDFLLTLGNLEITQFPPETDADVMCRTITLRQPLASDGSDLYLPLIITPDGAAPDYSQIGWLFPSLSHDLQKSYLYADGSRYDPDEHSSDGIPYSRLWSVYTNNGTTFMPLFGTGIDFVSACPVNEAFGTVNSFTLSTNQNGLVTNTADGGVATGFTFTTPTSGSNSGYGFDARNTSDTDVGSNTIFAINTVAGSIDDADNGPATSGFTVLTARSSYAASPSQPSPIRQIVQIVTTAATSLAGKYFLISTVSAAYYIWYKVDGSGADPAVGGRTGILVNVSSTDLASQVAISTSQVLSGFQISKIQTVAGSAVPAGSYFTFSTLSKNYYVYYIVDGVGTDPALSDKIGISVSILSTHDSNTVALLTLAAINLKYFAVPDARDLFLKGRHPGSPIDVDVVRRYSRLPNPIFYGSRAGTVEFDEVIYHTHESPDGNNFVTRLLGGVGGVSGDLFDGGDDVVRSTGGPTNRPFNMYVDWVVKY